MNAKAPPRAAPSPKEPRFYQPDGYTAEESVGYLMRRVMSTVAQCVDRDLEPAGLTSAQWMPLLKLYMGHASTVAELARETRMDAGAMTRLLDRLEAKGLCTRVRNSEDRRVVNIELTDAGREAADRIPPVLCQVQNAHLKGFTHEEWQLLKSFLRRMLDNGIALQAQGEKNEQQQKD